MMDERLGQVLNNDDFVAALKKGIDTAIDIFKADGEDGCSMICKAPAEALTNPVYRNILDQSNNAIDTLFLNWLMMEQTLMHDTPFSRCIGAAQLESILHSIKLRAHTDWTRSKLEYLTAGTVDRVLAAVAKPPNFDG